MVFGLFKKKAVKKSAGKAPKKAFGGYGINFARVENVTLGKVFGKNKIAPSQMTKLLWKFVKANKLGGK